MKTFFWGIAILALVSSSTINNNQVQAIKLSEPFKTIPLKLQTPAGAALKAQKDFQDHLDISKHIRNLDNVIDSNKKDLVTVGNIKKLIVKNDVTNRIRVESRLKGELPTKADVSNFSDDEQNILGTGVRTAKCMGIKV